MSTESNQNCRKSQRREGVEYVLQGQQEIPGHKNDSDTKGNPEYLARSKYLVRTTLHHPSSKLVD